MKNLILPLGLALATVPLSGCVTDGYGYGEMEWSSYPYSGWYNGYYGSIYDGYWGTDNYFYFRLDRNDHRFRRGDHEHFRRGDDRQDGRFRRFEGVMQPPPRGTRMPNFPQRDRQRPPR